MKRILIKNGRVVDPKQKMDKVINVLIEGNTISALTEEEIAADVGIDAKGKIVCPGFIDMHTHEDNYLPADDVLETHMGVSALKMGVTTYVGGNCGENTCRPDKYLDIIDEKGYPVNVAMLVGHTYLRNMNGKTDKYKPVTGEKIKEMVSVSEECLKNGCMGVSFGVKYIPGTTWDEIMSIVKTSGKAGKIVASHVRQDVAGVFDAADELARMGKEGNVKVQFSHIGSMGGYGQMKELLKQVEGFRQQGIDMMCDCYPYNAFSTGIGETTYDDGFLESYNAGYDSILIVNGKYKGMRATKEIFDELRKDAPETATVGYFMKSEDIEMALMSPLVMIGSDGVRVDGLGHPRASGTFPKFIKDYIKADKLSVIDGIAKITTMAAERLGLDKKGNLLPGSDADVVIFDLEKIKDCATYEDGQIPPEGINYVILGGEIALKDGKTADKFYGKSIRK